MRKSKSDMQDWELKQYEEGEEVGKHFMQFINSMNRGSKGFVDTVCYDHNTLQQSAMGVFMKCIKEWSEKEMGIDARNEATVKLCKRIMEVVKDEMYLPFI